MHVPIVCSIDSFLAAAIMGFAGCPEIYQRWAIAGFTLCDMVASTVGGAPGIAVPVSAVIPALAMAVLVLVHARRWPLLYLAMPVLLCIDNLSIGAADGPVPILLASLDGMSSAVLAWAGFTLGTAARGLWWRLRSGGFPGSERRSLSGGANLI